MAVYTVATSSPVKHSTFIIYIYIYMYLKDVYIHGRTHTYLHSYAHYYTLNIHITTCLHPILYVVANYVKECNLLNKMHKLSL